MKTHESKRIAKEPHKNFKNVDKNTYSSKSTAKSSYKSVASKAGSNQQVVQDNAQIGAQGKGESSTLNANEKHPRIAKKLAELGVCSRRGGEELIAQGRVKINNVVVTDMSTKVTFDDIVHVNGKKIENKKSSCEVYLFNKPRGYMCTNYDPEGRPTVFDIIPEEFGRLISIGRLDFNTEGLLILTNNGEFARQMELPSSNVRRTYMVKVKGRIDMRAMRELEHGSTINGVRYDSVFIDIDEKLHNGAWLRVEIFEGKNREIRKIMSYFNLIVLRLARVAYGKYSLGNIPEGGIVEYTGK